VPYVSFIFFFQISNTTWFSLGLTLPIGQTLCGHQSMGPSQSGFSPFSLTVIGSGVSQWEHTVPWRHELGKSGPLNWGVAGVIKEDRSTTWVDLGIFASWAPESNMYMSICTHTHIHVHIHTYAYRCVYVCVYINSHKVSNINIYLYIITFCYCIGIKMNILAHIKTFSTTPKVFSSYFKIH
jgi:hypothetical protein